MVDLIPPMSWRTLSIFLPSLPVYRFTRTPWQIPQLPFMVFCPWSPVSSYSLQKVQKIVLLHSRSSIDLVISISINCWTGNSCTHWAFQIWSLDSTITEPYFQQTHICNCLLACSLAGLEDREVFISVQLLSNGDGDIRFIWRAGPLNYWPRRPISAIFFESGRGWEAW